MKIKKVPADIKDAVVFSVNETDYSATDGWASISLPPVTFKGKGRVKFLFGIMTQHHRYNRHLFTFVFVTLLVTMLCP